jgi:hypothetical protein
VQQRLSPAACEAFQQSVAAAVDNNLRLYRQWLQQAQQQLLQRELGSAQTQHTNSNSSSQAPAVAQGDSISGSGQQPVAAGATQCTARAVGQQEAGSSSSAGGAGPSVDAAVLTMQQLVALLAKRDAQPEQEEGRAADRWGACVGLDCNDHLQLLCSILMELPTGRCHDCVSSVHVSPIQAVLLHCSGLCSTTITRILYSNPCDPCGPALLLPVHAYSCRRSSDQQSAGKPAQPASASAT